MSQYKKRFSRHENESNSIHEDDSNADNNEKEEADEEADGKHADNDADNEEMHQEDSITQDTDDADGIIDSSDDIAAKYISKSVLYFMMH